LGLPVDKSITSQDYRTFLRELRASRKRSGLTQADLARRLKETQSFVSKCERGERRLDVIELRAFCRAFGMPVVEFIRDLERTLAKPRRRG
jgi:transcriptional regulator with XRE-family HTH domain